MGTYFHGGNKWGTDRVGLIKSSLEMDFLPINKQGEDRSEFGVLGLSGNVMEWVRDWYQPYTNSDYYSKKFGKKYKVVRGGSIDIGHYVLSEFFMGSHRAFFLPKAQGKSIGFRCAKDA